MCTVLNSKDKIFLIRFTAIPNIKVHKSHSQNVVGPHQITLCLFRIKKSAPFLREKREGEEAAAETMTTIGIRSPTAILGSACARYLPLRLMIATARPPTISHSSPTRLVFCPCLSCLQPTKAPPARKFQVRAARTESKGVSLGFRAPDFEVFFENSIWALSFPSKYHEILTDSLPGVD